MKLSSTQQELIEWLMNNSRYELRQSGRAFIYDRELFCWYDWPIRSSTIKSLLDKGVIEYIGIAGITGDKRFALKLGTTVN